MSRITYAAAAMLLTAAASNVRAQLPAPAADRPTTPEYGQVVSVSPVFAMLGFYTGEIERRMTTNATLGASGSAFTIGPFGYKSLDAKLRFYPNEKALEGFAVGLSAGAIWLSADEGGLFSSESSGSGLVMGTEASYSWLTGKRHNLAFALGGGLKRIVRYGGYDVSGAQLTYPTVRASVGVAF